jgi:hypothetical protein
MLFPVKTLLTACLLGIMPTVQAQVLISLILGDDLNTGKIEFGLEGGATLSTINGLDGAEYKTGWNLGFYFDFKTKHRWSIATGVMVKSPWGAEGLAPYSVGDSTLDLSLAGGSVKRELRYFNVPVMIKYPVGRFFVMGGVQPSLGYKAFDVFEAEVNGEELTYRVENKKAYKPIDLGVVGAVGYRVAKGYGMNVLVRYYEGLTEITDGGLGWTNRGVHLLVGIPIGVGKARAKAATKQQDHQP